VNYVFVFNAGKYLVNIYAGVAFVDVPVAVTV
jgi:hypothetical protein